MSNLLAGIRFENPLEIVPRITSVLGDPRDYGPHEGYDLAAPAGTRINAAAGGTVTQAGYMPEGYGYYVEIDHGSGIKSLYGHMRSVPLVSKGDKVTQGEKIGEVGSTGMSTGPHLHFHIKEGNKYLDVGQYVNLGVAGIGRALGQVIDDPCLQAFNESGADFAAWKKCREENDLPASYDDLTESLTGEPADTGSDENPLSSLLGGSDLLSDALEPLIDFAYNVAFFAPKQIINAFSLSDNPLDDGRETYAWLSESGNERVFLAASVALVLILILFIVAVNRFLGDAPKTVIKGIANPVGTAVDAAAG